jgi:hypothetical protein
MHKIYYLIKGIFNMKYIKASICSVVAFSMLPYIQSAENIDLLLAELKKNKKGIPCGRYCDPGRRKEQTNR